MRLNKIIQFLLRDGEAIIIRKDGDSVRVSATIQSHRGTETTGAREVALHQCDGDGLVDPLIIAVAESLRGLRS